MSALPRRVIEPLDVGLARGLDRDGFLLLRQAFPAVWVEPLRERFEAGYIPSNQWPVPRGREWRHALVDEDPFVQSVCHLPVMLSAAARIIGAPFFLAQAEGREPLAGGGAQPLHRDGAGVVSALVFLDPYGPDNGATRVAPGTHHGEPANGADAETQALIIEGEPGDILLFDAELLHGGTLNRSGAPRRSLLVSYFPETALQSHLSTRAARNVRMEIAEIFEPAALTP